MISATGTSASSTSSRRISASSRSNGPWKTSRSSSRSATIIAGFYAPAQTARPTPGATVRSPTSAVELRPVRLAVDVLETPHGADVVARLGERDLHLAALRGARDPAVDVRLAGIVGSQGQVGAVFVAAVPVQQMAQVPAAVAHVQVGVEQVRVGIELRPAGVDGDALRGVG